MNTDFTPSVPSGYCHCCSSPMVWADQPAGVTMCPRTGIRFVTAAAFWSASKAAADAAWDRSALNPANR